MTWWSDLWDKIGKTALGTAFVVGGVGVVYLSGALPKDYKPVGQATGAGLIAYGAYRWYKALKPPTEVQITNFEMNLGVAPPT